MNIDGLKLYSEIDEKMILSKEIPDCIEHIKGLIDGTIEREKVYGKHSNGYIKTTENVNAYYHQLDFKGKSILTVVGAGDQVFNAVLLGAKKVDGFDISINSIMVYYLKEAAIKELDYDSFINFFYVENNCYDREVYNKIRNSLNEDAKKYWDFVFTYDSPLSVIKKITFGATMYPSAGYASMKLSSTSDYLSREGYETLKEKINDCKINISIRNALELDGIGSNYDYIILSNIFQYQKGKDIETFKQAIERYKELLNKDGIIIVGYAYNGVDLKEYSEYERRVIPSIEMMQGSMLSQEDSVIIARKST